MHNYYEILGIEASATEDVVKSAIRTARKRYRQVAGSPNREQARNAETMMDRLAEAEIDLLDASRRLAYDAKLADQPTQQQENGSSGSNDWIETAKNYLANGQPRNAHQAARQATMAAPEDIDAWTIRAYAALEMRDYSDADFSASEAGRRDSHNPQIAGMLGDIYEGESRYREAEQAFSRAAQLDPDNSYWQGRAAWSISDQGRTLEALTRIREISSKFPQSEYIRKVHSFILLEDADSALSVDEDGDKYFTNKKQVRHVKQRLEQVLSLGTLEDGVREAFNRISDHLKLAKKRQFARISVRRIVANILFLPITFIVFLIDPFGVGLFVLILNGLFIWWTIDKCWPHVSKTNKKALGTFANTGLQ